MKYRIKIITYKNGRKEYIAQAKAFIGWDAIDFEGENSFIYSGKCNSREEALNRIDLHFCGNIKEQTIEFEYINKLTLCKE